jgi:nitrogen fixation/metabolism regulation signal transduction histidine kinase
LECHSTPQAAPPSMIAVYGPYHGFGWKPGDVIGAQLVSVPMTVAQKRVDEVRLLFLIPYVGVFLVLFVALNVLLDVVVIGPIDRMAKIAEAVSMGDLGVPEYSRAGTDQIARLSGSINRLRRSLQEALRMLSDP